jgi:hypothetical protein
VNQCPTCGKNVGDLAAHQAEIDRRRKLYGASWDLEAVTLYRPRRGNVIAKGSRVYIDDDDGEEGEEQ